MTEKTGSEDTLADRTVEISRVIDAPPHLVFEAHTSPEHVKRWYGPKGWPLTLCEMDFCEGGRYRFAMTGPDGRQGPRFGGQYLEIVPNRKIVYDDAFESSADEKMVITVTFDDRDGRTLLTVCTVFATVAMKNAHLGMGFEEGFGSSLDQLAEVVAALGVADSG